MRDEKVPSLERRLLGTLQSLLELPALDLDEALTAASEHVAQALGCDKVDAFVLDEPRNTLVARGTSDTKMGRLQKALGLDVLPIANGGRVVEAFQGGAAFIDGRVDLDAGEIRGMHELGVKSAVHVPLEVAGVRRGVLSACSAQPEFFQQHDVGFLQSVAHWIGALAQRAELAAQMRTANLNQARRAAAEEIVTVLAHDIRNHLNPLLGRLHLLRSKAAQGQLVQVAEVDRAIGSVQRLSRLTSDLLDLGRLDQGLFSLRLGRLDVGALVTATASALSSTKNSIEVEAPAELVILADADRLSQALENVISNAVKHSPPGKPVRVVLGLASRGDVPHCQIEVIDQGPGIPPEIKAHLFERFIAGSDSHGLGLGLHLACQIARAHGGTLVAESKPGSGARFRFELPIDAAAASERPPT
jgi:two-component system, OmpR family, sensor kinase